MIRTRNRTYHQNPTLVRAAGRSARHAASVTHITTIPFIVDVITDPVVLRPRGASRSVGNRADLARDGGRFLFNQSVRGGRDL